MGHPTNRTMTDSLLEIARDFYTRWRALAHEVLLVKSQICRKRLGHAMRETQKDRDHVLMKCTLHCCQWKLHGADLTNRVSDGTVCTPAEPRLAADCLQRPLPPRGGSHCGGGWHSLQAGAPGVHPAPCVAYLPRHQRFSSASQWLHHVPFALLRRSMATWWRAHQPSWLAGGVGSGAWLGAAGWSLLAAA